MDRIFKNFNPDRIREIFLVTLILVMIGLFSIQIPNYINVAFVNRISTSIVILSVLAVGQTLVFLTRNFDISVGSIVGVSAYFVGFQLFKHPEIHPLLAILMAIGVGMICGAINGAIISYGRVPSVICTLGTLALFRTFVIEYANSLPVMSNQLPDWITTIGGFNSIVLLRFRGLELRMVFVIMVIVVIIVQLMLSYHRFGRRLYAIGSNTDAARIAGFPNVRIVFTAFLISGGLAGLAGFLFLARFSNVTLQAGMGLEFASITAVVIGGVSNKGGTGSVFGAFLGAVFIILLENSLYRSLAVSEFWRDAILGMLILGAVIADYIIIGKLRRVWARRALLDH